MYHKSKEDSRGPPTMKFNLKGTLLILLPVILRKITLTFRFPTSHSITMQSLPGKCIRNTEVRIAEPCQISHLG